MADTPKPPAGSVLHHFCHSRAACPRENGEWESSRRVGCTHHCLPPMVSSAPPQDSLSTPLIPHSWGKRKNVDRGTPSDSRSASGPPQADHSRGACPRENGERESRGRVGCAHHCLPLVFSSAPPQDSLSTPLAPHSWGRDKMGAEGHPLTPGRSFSCTSLGNSSLWGQTRPWKEVSCTSIRPISGGY